MRTFLRASLATFIALAAGCAADDGDVAGRAESDLLELPAASQPLAPLDEDEDWEDAPAGCEDRLASSQLTFRVASFTYGLVAAVEPDGDIVCVDTVQAVQEELDEQGDAARADELGDRYLLALSYGGLPIPRGLVAGDPTPQPNTELRTMSPHDGAGGADRGDPTPQPNTNPR